MPLVRIEICYMILMNCNIDAARHLLAKGLSTVLTSFELVNYWCIKRINFTSIRINTLMCDTDYSDPSLYRASPIAASLLRGIFYSDNVSYLVFIAI